MEQAFIEGLSQPPLDRVATIHRCPDLDLLQGRATGCCRGRAFSPGVRKVSETRRQKAFWRRFCHFTATGGPARDVSDSATQHSASLRNSISFEIFESLHLIEATRQSCRELSSPGATHSSNHPGPAGLSTGVMAMGQCCQGARRQGSQRGCQDRDPGSDTIRMSHARGRCGNV